MLPVLQFDYRGNVVRILRLLVAWPASPEFTEELRLHIARHLQQTLCEGVDIVIRLRVGECRGVLNEVVHPRPYFRIG